MPNGLQPLIILVATATDRKVDRCHLRELPAERRAIRDALQAAEQKELCKFEPLADATLDDVFGAFQRYRDRVAIFHFAGHANSFQLLLDSAAGRPEAAGRQGLAEFLGQQRGLQLVFLNGCSTYGHAKALHQAGVWAVVSTSRAIVDDVARRFAARFYRALGTGASVEIAFKEAEGEARAGTGDDCRAVKRDIDPDESGPDISRDGWPWDIKVKPGAESVLDWSLTHAAGDPTFGLPAVPKGDLPEQAEGPYLGLRRFERKHAELFFGRGGDVRALYKWLTAGEDTPPILLLHGQSGVGKSSLLEAGLQPRLEADYEVRLRRRDSQRGVLWSLADALDAKEGDDLLRAWIEAESRLGRPLVVVLDQVEEALTQPIEALPSELEDVSAALVAIFGDERHRPQGKLVLGLRKDYYPEVEARLKTAGLYRNDYFLEPLSRPGIVEAITGPARNARLRNYYKLQIEPPKVGEEPLPDAIADDLRQDRDSPIAPTLQVLLSKMWEMVRDKDERRLGRALYEKLAKAGGGNFLDTFLDEQLSKLATWQPDLAKTGLFLDFLASYSTPFGTARARTWKELRTDYAHHEALLPDLIERCKRLRLLAEEAGPRDAKHERTTRLGHDALATLIRYRVEISPAPGQQARRILESRARNWQEGRTGAALGEADVRTVERGAAGMRVATGDEQRLLAASRKLQRILTAAQAHRDPVVRALVVTALDAYPVAVDRTRSRG
jgi:hypothetical protein